MYTKEIEETMRFIFRSIFIHTFVINNTYTKDVLRLIIRTMRMIFTNESTNTFRINSKKLNKTFDVYFDFKIEIFERPHEGYYLIAEPYIINEGEKLYIFENTYKFLILYDSIFTMDIGTDEVSYCDLDDIRINLIKDFLSIDTIYLSEKKCKEKINFKFLTDSVTSSVSFAIFVDLEETNGNGKKVVSDFLHSIIQCENVFYCKKLSGNFLVDNRKKYMKTILNFDPVSEQPVVLNELKKYFNFERFKNLCLKDKYFDEGDYSFVGKYIDIDNQVRWLR